MAANPFHRHRPPGIVLLVAWSVVVGVSIGPLAAYEVYVRREVPQLFSAFLAAPDALVAVAVLVGLLQIVIAVGLWSLRPWGRLLAIGFAVASAAFGFVTLPAGVLAIGFSAATVWYLRGREAREAFLPRGPPIAAK